MTDLSVSQVGFDTGFSSSSYFTKCFKSQYGLLPLAYRELCRRKRD
jgi:transcriptional regulator GlxA family with amidase domain